MSADRRGQLCGIRLLRGLVRVSLAMSVFLLQAPSGWAQSGSTVQAETLFREGKKLLEAKKYEEACSKLEASHRIDPATGTLLALAFCHEKQGKTATAWAEYLDAASRAKSEGRKDRHKKARERSEALLPTLSKLTLQVQASTRVAGLQIERDGLAIDPASWGTAIPVDPGEHLVVATAPGYLRWRNTVVVGPSQEKTVEIGPLEREPAAASQPTVIPSASSVAPPVARPPNSALAPRSSSTPQPPQPSSTLPTVGLLLGGAGIVVLGVGGYFGLRAMSKNDDASAHCVGNRCDPTGMTLRNDALDAASVSTIGFVAGAVLVGTGATLYLIGKKGSEGASPSVGVLMTPRESRVSLALAF